LSAKLPRTSENFQNIESFQKTAIFIIKCYA